MQTNNFVYVGRDNTIELELRIDGSPIVHTGLTRCLVSFDETILDSQSAPLLFDMTNVDRIILKFGGASLTPGRYLSRLVVFDAAHTNGLVWGDLVISVKN